MTSDGRRRPPGRGARALGALLVGLGERVLRQGRRLQPDDGPLTASPTAALAAQAAAVDALQRQSQIDEVSGLPLRRHFLALMQRCLAEGLGGPGAALLLVRVQHLEALNHRLGHDATDRVLGALGDILQTYVERVPGTCAGRLNGSDFALCLPVAGVATETAASLRLALAAAPALRSGHAEVAVGGVDFVRDSHAGAVLAAADDALAQAEVQGGLGDPALAVLSLPSARREDLPGAHAWRSLLARALDDGRYRLVQTPALDARGSVCLHDGALHLQLQPGGAFEAPERWRALARRSRLLPRADLAGIDATLLAGAGDPLPCTVTVSPVSLATPGFVADVAVRLAAAPAAARRLLIICSEAPASDAGLPPLAAAATAWRPWGTRLGVGVSATLAQRLPALQAAGVQALQLHADQGQGAADDPALRDYLQGLVQLAHGLALTVRVTGRLQPPDHDALRALGFDAVAAPAAAEAAARP